MKTVFFAFITLLFVSCSSDDDSNNNNDDQFANIVNLLPEGTWRVSAFIEDDNNQTDTFESFTFDFNENGEVIATNDILSEVGSWSYDNDDSSDDDGNDDDEKLNLSFPTGTIFEELTEDWRITAANSTTISLYHISGGDGSEDLLVFTKI